MNRIEQYVQDKTPLTQEEANEIRNLNLELEIELNSKIVEIDKIRSNFETKSTNLTRRGPTLKSFPH